ncbi:MAG: adenosine kinase [Acidimicrobiales bacterium]|nr:adenosine kinase [Acidimicrobiales bacterium]
MGTPLDVVGVGNALVDVISLEQDAFIGSHGLVKGAMTLIDTERAEALYGAMGPGIEMSGGSAANTMAGLASLGGHGGFIGRVRDDQLGTVFGHDIRAVGVEFPSVAATSGQPTGRSLIIVTPDGERTMNTYLGAASELQPDDVDEALVARAQVTYLEGYLFDREAAGEAFKKAARAAHDAGRLVALTLSDSFCVERFLGPFRELVTETVDVLFGNDDELRLLYETDDLDAALTEAERHCHVVAVTRGAEGALVSSHKRRMSIAAVPVDRVVDTTGAGDLFAAGFLYGLTRDLDPETCGKLGAVAAAEVISHVGARPETVLAGLAAPLLL